MSSLAHDKRHPPDRRTRLLLRGRHRFRRAPLLVRCTSEGSILLLAAIEDHQLRRPLRLHHRTYVVHKTGNVYICRQVVLRSVRVLLRPPPARPDLPM